MKNYWLFKITALVGLPISAQEQVAHQQAEVLVEHQAALQAQALVLPAPSVVSLQHQWQ